MPSDQITMLALKCLLSSETNPRKTFPEPYIKQLADTIQEHGLLSPLLVVQLDTSQEVDGNFYRMYEVVTGGCRLRALRLIHQNNDLPPSIACIVRELSRDQIIMIQMAENLARQDLNPMEEAWNYQFIIDNTPYNTAELVAAQVGKTAYHVSSRLKLLDLQGAALHRFVSGTLPLSHALEIARLTPADQDQVESLISDSGTAGVRSVEKLREIINSQILRNLHAVPFNKEDPNLCPDAGACSTCLKRSSNGSLFADFLEVDDKCFDAECFQLKIIAHVIECVNHVAHNVPETLIIKDERYDLPVSAVMNAVDAHKLHIVRFREIYEETAQGADGARSALILNGPYSGRFIFVKAKVTGNPKTAQGKIEAPAVEKKVANLDDQLETVKKRMERNEEIRDEKYFQYLVDAFQLVPEFTAPDKPVARIEQAIIVFILYNELNGENRAAINNWLPDGFGELDDPTFFFEACKVMDRQQMAVMIRRLMFQKWKHSNKSSPGGYFLLKLMEQSIPEANRKKLWDQPTQELILKNDVCKKKIKELEKAKKKAGK